LHNDILLIHRSFRFKYLNFYLNIIFQKRILYLLIYSLLYSIIKKGSDIISKKTNTEYVPTDDIMFHLLFGRNKNKNLTDSFIKSTLKYVNENYNLHNIKIRSEVSPERLNLYDKTVRLDLLAEYNEGLICIEMQNTYNANIYKRARCYAAKVESTYLKNGEDYSSLKPLTMIVILNELPSNLNNPNIMQNLVTVDTNYRFKDIDLGLKFIFIFLPNLKNISSSELETNEFLQWLKFLEFKDMEVINNMASKNATIKQAKEEYYWLTAEEEERNLKRFEENAILDLQLTRCEGFAEGLEQR